jgi:hypothetical protein
MKKIKFVYVQGSSGIVNSMRKGWYYYYPERATTEMYDWCRTNAGRQGVDWEIACRNGFVHYIYFHEKMALTFTLRFS